MPREKKPKRRLTERWVKSVLPTPGRQMTYFDAGMPGLVLSVSYGGSKTWTAVHYVNSKPRTKKLGRFPVMNLEAAREAAREFLNDPEAAKAKAARDTFEGVAELFMEEHVRAKKLRSEADFDRCIKKYLMPEWRHRIFEDIDRPEIRRRMNAIASKHGPRMSDMVLAIFSSMAGWWAGAYSTKYYDNPVVKRMKKTSTADRARDRVLTNHEIGMLWRACDEIGSFGNLVKVLLLTTQRKSKVANMKWADIEDGVWIIPKETNEKGNAGALALPPIVQQIIQSQPKIAENPFVFPAAVGNGPFNSFSQRKAELDKKIEEITGIKFEPWVIHDLRRTAATLLEEAKVLPELIERVLGHKRKGIEATYQRSPYFKPKADALLALAIHVAQIVNPPPPNVIAISVHRHDASAHG